MTQEKRSIGNYTVLASIQVGENEIALCENRNAPKDSVYLCGYIEQNDLFERLTDCLVSDSYADIAACYGERIVEKAEETQKKIEEYKKRIGENSELGEADCMPVTSEDSLVNKVIVLRGTVLHPEYRNAANQLLYCVGGFGAQPNARGRTCFAYSLYDGSQRRCRRDEIIGVIPEENLPEWAADWLAEINSQSELIDRSRDDRGER